jgi:hypothetical protein
VARPAEGYRSTIDHARLPGTSTIASLIKESGGLIHWAWTEGKEGRDYRETAKSAANAGTLVHDAAEAWKHGRPYEWTGSPDLIKKAQRGYRAFLEWTQQTRLKIEQTEVSLVSERHRFGGTFDALLLGDKRVMADYKTASSVYPEHLLQVVAYAKLWEEHHPDQPIEGGYYILRFSRDYGDFAANWYGELEDAWAAFLHCRALYDLKAALAKRCR